MNGITKAWQLSVLAVLAAGCGTSPPDTTAASTNSSAPEKASGDGASAPSEASPGGLGGAIGGTLGEAVGHAATNKPIAGLARVTGTPKENAILRLQVTEAGFFPLGKSPSPGRRYYTVGLRGTSRSDAGQLLGGSKGDDVVIDAQQFVFGQNERGCLSKPEFDVTGVPNLFEGSMTFPAGKTAEGRLTFLVPDDTQRVRVLIAPAGSDGLAVPAGDDFKPAWPKPIHTIEDGTTLKVLVLPSPVSPPTLPRPAAGREHVVLDVVIQNLSTDQGIEFQPSQQLRLMNPSGEFVEASATTQRLGCRMDDGESIPPGQVRRLMAVYEMPVSGARRLHYRGFEREEAVVAIR